MSTYEQGKTISLNILLTYFLPSQFQPPARKKGAARVEGAREVVRTNTCEEDTISSHRLLSVYPERNINQVRLGLLRQTRGNRIYTYL